MKKNKMLIIFAIVALFVGVNNAFALNIASCESSLNEVIIDEKIPNVVSTIITVIKIVVPILLIIFGMLDLMKGITAQKEDEIKKGQQIFIKRLIAGALVFFVFTIVQVIISFVADAAEKDNIMTCAQCFINGDCTYKTQNGVCTDGTKLDGNGHCVK